MTFDAISVYFDGVITPDELKHFPEWKKPNIDPPYFLWIYNNAPDYKIVDQSRGYKRLKRKPNKCDNIDVGWAKAFFSMEKIMRTKILDVLDECNKNFYLKYVTAFDKIQFFIDEIEDRHKKLVTLILIAREDRNCFFFKDVMPRDLFIIIFKLALFPTFIFQK
jgi:hypothetical protein